MSALEIKHKILFLEGKPASRITFESCYFNLTCQTYQTRTHPSIYDYYQLCKIIPGTTDTHASAFSLKIKLRIQRSLLEVFHAEV